MLSRFAAVRLANPKSITISGARTPSIKCVTALLAPPPYCEMADARASAGRNLSQRGPVPGGAPSLPGLRRRLRHDRVRAQHRRRVQWAVQLRAASRIRLHRLLFVPTLRSLVAPASDPHAPVDSTECTFDVTGTDLAAGVGSYMTAMRSFATCAEQYEEGKIVILSPNCLLSVSLIQEVSLFQRPATATGHSSTPRS